MRRPAAILRSAVLILSGLMAVVAASQAETPAAAPSESEVKAAFVLNFAKFTEWPDSSFAGPNAPMVLGVYGQEAMREALLTVLKDKTIKNRPLLVEMVGRESAALRCHVLVVSGLPEADRSRLLASLANAAVLTIGMDPGFVDQGGVMGLVPAGKKLEFEVNRTVATRAGLTLSSKVLALARRVVETDEQANR